MPKNYHHPRRQQQSLHLVMLHMATRQWLDLQEIAEHQKTQNLENHVAAVLVALQNYQQLRWAHRPEMMAATQSGLWGDLWMS